MKRILAVCIVVIVLIVSGCATISQISTDTTVTQASISAETEISSVPELPSKSHDSSITPEISATENPSPSGSDNAQSLYKSYLSFCVVLEARIKEVYAKTGNNKELDHVNTVTKNLDGCTGSIMPILAIWGETGISSLKSIGFSDIQTSVKDDTYIIDYTNPKGGKCEQTCKYDSSNDSMQTVVRDDTGKINTFFEYIKTKNGYASQVYQRTNSGLYMIFKSFFNDKNTIACGIIQTDKEPFSMLDETGFSTDYVKSCYMYFILNGDKLTVCENGKTSKY